MNILLLILLFACIGKERWDIKTLQDGFMPSGSPMRSTIHAERRLTAPKWSETLSRQPLEKVTVKISGEIIACGFEADSDVHLDFSDGKETMVAEIPKSEYANPKYMAVFQAARTWIRSRAGKIGRIHLLKNPIPCTILGVRFFDKPAHGKGGAPNGIEIHPVLDVR